MSEYTDLKLDVARLMVAEADLWKMVHGESSNEVAAVDLALYYEMEKFYGEIQTEIDKGKLALANHPDSDVMTYRFSGTSYEVDHYDIDDAIDKYFPEGVMTDSESGCFFAYTTPAKAADLRKFLEKKYPSLDFDSENTLEEKGDFLCLTVPGLTSWNSAAQFVKENA